MPIEESYREQALEKVQRLGKVLEEELQNLLKEVEEEDLDFGVSASLSGGLLSSLWKECVEDNNYMEVSFVEVMEHHDGAYLKATFRNSTQNYTAERYVSVRSSGRVEISYAFFVERDGVVGRVEREPDGGFKVFLKAK
ncbi:MAG: hypothetical protein RQ827_00485 [Thermocrinis sp.]|jgi:hypothetical protein|nr:hypothetical protein [Thermocrinis sp.]